MVKVICIKCESIGYTASPQQVKCSECGGRHRVIRQAHNCLRLHKRSRVLSMLGALVG